MNLVVGAVQVGFVWLTAVTTLVASLPHFGCICPNGTQKLFCPGASSSSAGCCCGGSCCSSHSDGNTCCSEPQKSSREQVKHSCCCKSHRQPTLHSPATGIQVKGSCCQKILASSEFVGLSPTNEYARQCHTDSFFALLPQLSFVSNEPMAGHTLFSWHRYALPPPTDLVLTLQHFIV